jgi:D-tagatose-1,6-bisphosphate aldolase subunit GatZ/KbaZ
VYVIGTEVPIPGGEANLAQAGAVTSPRPPRARWTCTAGLHGADLHGAWRRVIAMVVQPGVDFDHSQIQHYDAAAAVAVGLHRRPARHRVRSPLHRLPARDGPAPMVRDHFAILKVGPAATFALREALMALCPSRPNCCRPASARA